MTTPELPPLKASTCARNSQKSEPVVRSYTAKSVKARERVLLARIAEADEQRGQWAGLCVRLEARIAELESVLSETVALYGKPGGPWNIPSDPGGWLERARAAISGSGVK